MSEIFLFKPKAELDASENLRRFIQSCRNELTVFGEKLPFDENIWDISDWINLNGHGNKRHRLVFSNLLTVNEKSPVSMAEPYLSFAKAYFRYMQGFRPIVGTGPRLAALRALEAALCESGGEANPVRVDLKILNRAAQMIVDKFTEASAYRIGGQLEILSEFLTDNGLTTVPSRWRNFIKRPGDAVRVGKDFDERRKEKLPSQAALDALPKVFRVAIEPTDVVVSSVAAILCAAPDRISEVLTLPVDCEVRQEMPGGEQVAYGLRWLPAKGGGAMVKWVVPSMADVVKEAVGKIRKITDAARQISKWYEMHPTEIYLPEGLEDLRGQGSLTLSQLSDILGMAGSNSTRAWCKYNHIKVENINGEPSVNFSAVEKVVVSMLPRDFPILEKNSKLKYSEALFVFRVNELHARRSTYQCLVETININQINDGLGARVSYGFPSIFTRLGFAEPDGSELRVSTHQFRHYLNTLAQAGGLSQLDIAKWSGRKDIRQNAAYDHVTPGQMVQKIRDAIGDDSTLFGPLAELAKKTLIPRDEFARLVVPTAHTTEFGYCIHDYTMSPCQQHRDCIHCTDMICVKGDEEKESRLRIQLEEARNLLHRAEEAAKDGYFGSDRWMEHHKSTLERLTQLNSIIEDPKVPKGAVIQLSLQKAVVQQVAMQQSRLNTENGKNHASASPSSTTPIMGE